MTDQSLTLDAPSTRGTMSDEEQRLRMLSLARELEQMGRQTERFLSMQLQQLEVAMRDFDQERASWQKQKERELRRLEHQRNLLQARSGGRPAAHPCDDSPDDRTDGSPEKASAEWLTPAGSGSDPLRVLMRPGSASAMQIGLLMFEFSKLNRELGGQGVRFELNDCRTPKRGLFGRKQGHDQQDSIVELQAFSCRPLHSTETGRGSLSTDLQIWGTFKSCILLSTLANNELEQVYRRTEAIAGEDESRSVVSDAARRADHANSNCYDTTRRYGPICQASLNSKAAREQLTRLERTVSFLAEECHLQIHVSLI